MKKLITKLFLGIAIIASFQASAQYCGSPDLGGYPPSFNYGFGDYNTFTCITRGQCDSLVIPFTVYENFTVTGVGTIPVYKLQFNSIDSLPCGLCWSTSVSGNPNNMTSEFNRDDMGCIKISGLTNDAAGSYQLVLTLNVATSTANDTAFNPVSPIDSRAGGVTIWIKVIDAGAQCPDTVDETLRQHPSTSCTNTGCTTGINEVSKTLTDLTIQPNPMSNQAKVNFTAENGGVQQITITDIDGREVYNTTMNAKAGSNTMTISRNNMSAGSYILYVGNATGTATRKFIITE
jgi:hypothetical protein